MNFGTKKNNNNSHKIPTASYVLKDWLHKRSEINGDYDSSTVKDLNEWLRKQVAVPKPTSAINWKDYKVGQIQTEGLDSSEGFGSPPVSRAGVKNYRLVPYTVMVHRVGKAPYFSRRWKKVATQQRGEFHIIPVNNYKGDLNVLYDAWQGYINSFETEDHSLLVPLVALQEFIYKKHDGILMSQDNRIVGIVSMDVSENDDAKISILSASPLEIKNGQEDYIEGALRAGAKQYAEFMNYSIVIAQDEEGDDEDIIDEEIVNEDDIDYIQKGVDSIRKAVGDVEINRAKAKNLVPQSGDWYKPGRWVKPSAAAPSKKKEDELETPPTPKRGRPKKEPTTGKKTSTQVKKPKKSTTTPTEVISAKDDKTYSFNLKISPISSLPRKGKIKDKARVGEMVELSSLYQPKEGLDRKQQIKALNQWFKSHLGSVPVSSSLSKIDPAWNDVQIVADPSNTDVDVLVTATDPNSTRWHYPRITTKSYEIAQKDANFGRVATFTRHYDELMARIKFDANHPKQKKIWKNAAAALWLMDAALMRPGNTRLGSETAITEETGEVNVGVVQLQRRHVELGKNSVTLNFRGKSSRDWADVTIKDPDVVNMIKERMESMNEDPNSYLFDGIDERHLNRYLTGYKNGPGITNNHFTPKDFRTFHGTKVAATLLRRMKKNDVLPTNAEEYRQRLTEIATEVGNFLHNTPSVALYSYVSPKALDELKSKLNEEDKHNVRDLVSKKPVIQNPSIREAIEGLKDLETSQTRGEVLPGLDDDDRWDDDEDDDMEQFYEYEYDKDFDD